MSLCETAIQRTQCWLENIVIGQKLCPFAKREFLLKRIHYQCMSADFRITLSELQQECQRLDKSPEIETSLLIYPESLEDFEDYLDYSDIAQQLLIDKGYEGVYQLATFHPKYCFAETEISAPENYTNRSPYPILHILREESLEIQLARYPNPETIPERNIEHMRELGTEKLEALLKQCQ